jgi:mRNA interferase RelE/StbE
MYNVKLYKQAAKYYDRLDTKTQRRVNAGVNEMSKNPFEGPHIRKLKGRLEGKFRYDIGGLRIIYEIDVDTNTIYVEAIGPRGDIYK